MARRLPPLNAARAFEAAARHLSFTLAAEELAVTQAAVSHQVRGLEDWLGVQLFHRANRRIELSDAGQAYLPGLREGLDRIAASTAAVADRARHGPVHLSALQSLTARWLLPRLPDFYAQHPELDVLLAAGDRPVDLHREDFHLAIRFTTRARAEAHGLVVTHLMDEAIFPVCAPGLATGSVPLRTPNDLAGQVLLHDKVDDSAEDPGWRVWCQAAGIAPPVGPTRHFSDAGLVLQAATAGQGVALARLSLVREDLDAERLVRPFGPVVRTRFSYYALTTPALAQQPRVRAMVEWLATQAHSQATDPLLAEAVPAGATA
jgi:LysR family glycine cleavage system transcriptional activator